MDFFNLMPIINDPYNVNVMNKRNKIIYWMVTIFLSVGMLAGGIQPQDKASPRLFLH